MVMDRVYDSTPGRACGDVMVDHRPTDGATTPGVSLIHAGYPDLRWHIYLFMMGNLRNLDRTASEVGQMRDVMSSYGGVARAVFTPLFRGYSATFVFLSAALQRP